MGDQVVQTVTVKVAGDATGAKSALNDTATASQTAASKIKSHFSSLFSSLSNNQALSPILGQFSELTAGFEGLGEKAESLTDKISAVGLGVVGAGTALTLLGDKGKTADTSLATAFTNAGYNVNDYSKQIDGAVSKMAGFGYTSEQTKGSIQALVQAGVAPTKAITDLGVAANLAAARHISLSDATNQVVQILNGAGTRSLKQFGITVSATAVTTKTLTAAQTAASKAHEAYSAALQKLTQLEDVDHTKKKLTIADQIALQNAQQNVTKTQGAYNTAQQKVTTTQTALKDSTNVYQQRLDDLATKVKGQASDASDTFTGKLKTLRAEIENHVTEIGQKYGPAITGVGAGMAVAGQAANGLKSVLGLLSSGTETATEATEGMTEATEASDVAMDSNPIGLIVIAIAALIAAVVLLATHWKQVFDGIKAAVSAAWKFIDSTFVEPIKNAFETVVNFIKQHWQLILAIITGPIGLAILFITEHFNAILGFFEAIPGKIEGFFSGIGKWFSDTFQTVVGDIEGVVGAIISWFEGMPQKISNAFEGIFKLMTNIGHDIINGIVQGIEDLASSIGGAIQGIVSHIPGASLLKKVPGLHFLAEGGIITKPTLAVVGEAGPEAIIPLNNPYLQNGASIQSLPSQTSTSSSRSSGTVAGNTNNTTINLAAITNASATDIANEITYAYARQVA